jgi:hypothetical protein
MPYLERLKEINPRFKATLFSSPGLAPDSYWDAHPDWIELAVHGHLHPDPYECAHWSKERTLQALESAPERFVKGWKSPGWQTSDGVYEALLEQGWWIADQHLEDHRRPPGLRTYFYEDGDDRIHTHSHNVCGNGLEETWEELVRAVSEAEAFLWASEALDLGPDPDDSR